MGIGIGYNSAVNFSDLIGQISLGQIPDNLITPAKLATTGTPDGTTFLRGDGLWATPAGGTSNRVLLYSGTTGTAETSHVCTGLTLVGYQHLELSAEIRIAANDYFGILFGADANDSVNYYTNLISNNGTPYNSAGSRLVNVALSAGFIRVNGTISQNRNAGGASDTRLFQGQGYALQVGVNGLASEFHISRDSVTVDADLTQLALYCHSASGIGVGSRFAVWGCK